MIAGVIDAAAAAPMATGVGLGEVLRVVVSLAAVLALVIGVGWLTRRAQGRVGPAGRRLRCIESLTVGNKQRVLLIQVGTQQVLVGASAGGLTTLEVLAEPVAPAPRPTAVAPDLRTSFRAVLAQFGKHA
ncbi:MAG TPA: flagellar biosynthetic protein FliO [Rhodanobacteraceae bacterium]|nr:flagellar biosynthetic protein FliO [Rhodanobacteraceae bacterium]